ncbi:EF hand repeat-containing protein [Streptomyces sp. 150FB]|jgi:Ca2+-binding EF-hand superfamily protein|uniref:EF-hand domain-containing protein n=1 Tax=Streptomyces sp. 150FB TaxID=1576605 RepID=UPI0005894AFA|nr:EF-hand domain-containing protein [Streptomyces sp. 150FB]KIF75538.1 EF hand repeat-containing protein [Streptomyces sp. 150FB]
MADIEALRAAFDQFDLDKDGAITATEFRSVLAGLGDTTMSESQAQALLDGADSDGDGRMTWDEFLALRSR